MKDLIKKAIEASEKSYSPYSKYPVGAAILMKDGNVITGVNVENASYGLTNCAERTALFTAVTQGYKKEDIVAMSIAAGQEEIGAPCGACRQVINELVPKKAPLFLTNLKGEFKESTIEDLLPFSFGPEDLDV